MESSCSLFVVQACRSYECCFQVNGLCACVHDSSVLVQRSALDLLQVGFPMHNSQLLKSDMTRLVTASLATILRRDMSLNRSVSIRDLMILLV